MKQQKLVSKGIDTVMYNNNQISVFQAKNKFWSVREFGPLWVPAKNMTVVIDSASWIVYKALIEWEQKKKMHLKLNKVYLGDSLINAYCFTKILYCRKSSFCLVYKKKRNKKYRMEKNVFKNVKYT